ncbi:MAG: SEL1-like repeat protein [Woeseiaceae bacterium]|nr:SEL1-like repeat protein [Woeseiaceae bacterium]
MLSLRFVAVSILLTIAMAAIAQEGYLGEAPTRTILKAQEKADAYFAKGKFDKAMLIYRDDLAPVGDKYAQYMVAYMILAGNGVQEDAIVASAWYRLAAQRENEQYVRIRDGLLSLFNGEQRARSDLLYIDLRRKMGDITLVNELIRDDMKILRRRNTPKLRLEVEIDRRNRGYNQNDFDAVASRIVSRIEFMERQMGLETTLDDAEHETLTTLVHEAKREVEAYRASR